MRGVAPGELLDPIIFHQGPLEGQLIQVNLYRGALNQVFRKWLFSENHPLSLYAIFFLHSLGRVRV